MSESDILSISRTKDRASDDVTDAFIIEEEIKSMKQEEFEEIYANFARWQPEIEIEIPLYRIFWKRSAVFENGVRLLHMVSLYRRLSRRVREQDVEYLQYDELDVKYRALVYDVAETHDIEVQDSKNRWRISAFKNRGLAILQSFIILIAFVVDQLFSMCLRSRFTRPQDIETAFVPVRSHFDRMEPVMSEFNDGYDLIVPTATVNWLRRRSRYPDLASYDPTPLNVLSTPRDVTDELALLMTGVWPTILTGRLDRTIGTVLQDELGVAMPRCISTEVNTWLRSRSFTVSCLVYGLSSNIAGRTGCESLVVGSAGPKGKAIMAAGDKHGARVFHLRHSVVTGYTPDPPFNSTEFVEGQVAMTHLENAEHTTEMDSFVPTGFQYLADSYENRKTEYELDTPVNVLVATQPYEDETRLTFLNRVMEATTAMSTEVSITIKTHPRESTDLYDRQAPDDVSVVNQDLETHLRNSDLVFTINSNVGLEAMLAGTPCVCINEFKPMIQTMPYAEYGPVPVLHSSDAVMTYFDGFGLDSLQSLYEHQQDVIEDGFILDHGAGRRMATHICQS